MITMFRPSLLLWEKKRQIPVTKKMPTVILTRFQRYMGFLFSGNDVDDLYAPGEELIQKTVMAYDDEMQEVETAVTDNAGHFSMKLKTNRQYRFVATIDDVLVEKEGVFITSDQFVKLVYSPPPSEDDLLTVDIQ